MSEIKEKETINKRIAYILEKEELAVSDFAKKLGAPWMTANNMIIGKNPPSYKNIVKIIELFSWVDANWLIMGRKSTLEDKDKKKLYTMIDAQQKTIDAQQRTIDRLTKKLIDNLPDDDGKKVAIAE